MSDEKTGEHREVWMRCGNTFRISDNISEVKKEENKIFCNLKDKNSIGVSKEVRGRNDGNQEGLEGKCVILYSFKFTHLVILSSPTALHL